jgi:uncharacterized cupin superfamily protein
MPANGKNSKATRTPSTSTPTPAKDGSKIMGTWICTPGKWRVDYVKWEYCHFQEGYCVITPDGMAPIHLRAGDIFVVEPGMKGTWEVVETVRKYFVFA